MTGFSFRLRYDPKGQLPPAPDAAFADGRLILEGSNLHPPLRVLHRDGGVLALLGHPIADDRRDDAAVLDSLSHSPDPPAFLRALNGSFVVLLYEPESGALTLANDRFASLAIYYRSGATGFEASLSASALRPSGERQVDEAAVFEFLHLRRLLGEKTYDPEVHYLRSASLLALSPDAPDPKVSQYWSPDFAVPPPADGDLTDRLAEALRHATAIHTADPQRYGLLLSGGLDSRAILAAMPATPRCVTTALARNNEVAVAAEVANAAGAEHHFIPRPPDLHDQRLDEAVTLTGGMQVYSETQFLGYDRAFAPLADCFLIGLGFDIFFGGLYLPKDTVNILGRPALHHRLRDLPTDLAGAYLSGVKYRLRTSDPLTVVKPEARARLQDALRQSVEQILARGRALGATGYDLWEYLHLHNLSRHYSFPMMASLRGYAECRSPALENGLFDLAIAMSAEQKCNGTAYQRAIAKLNPAVMAVRNANTNLRAATPLPHQTWIKAAQMAGNRVFGTAYATSPGWQERSWPSPAASLAASPTLGKRVATLGRSEPLADLGFLDLTAIGRVVDDHAAGRHDHAVLLNLLLTLDSALGESSRRA